MKNTPATLAKRNELKRKHFAERAAGTPMFVDGVCTKCTKPSKLKFNRSFTQTGKPEYRGKCQSCHTLRERELRKNNRAKLTLKIKLRKRETKVKLIVQMGSKCQHCPVEYNGKNATIFQFHHSDPKVKDFSLSAGMGNVSLDRIKKEIEKCILLCANCHSMEHNEEY